jgi:DNA-binding HxlR family transcriptional regulator
MKKDTMNKRCTIYKTAEFIGKRWTLIILLEMHKKNNSWKRYNQIKKNLLNITPKMLSLRLKELANEGLIKKRVNKNCTPITSEYSLTRSGEEFIKIVKSMKSWALKWKFRSRVCETTDCNLCEI